jgi:mono/diheme cytochrome c family protein
MIFYRNLFFLFCIVSLPACKNAGNETKLSALELKGKSAYLANCIICHNPNPLLAGSVGPEIANSSLELITARVMHAGYPAGHKPKRQSRLMAALPMLEKDIPAIHAYLNTFKKQ